MDASRNIVAQYTYNAWGEIISSSGSMKDINPLRYRGYYYDSETGFYYLQSRYYDPANHRFINADSYYDTGTGFLGYNMFAYCNNNPANGSDLTGEYVTRLEFRNVLIQKGWHDRDWGVIHIPSPPFWWSEDAEEVTGATNQMRSGVTNVIKGFKAILLPDPTIANDVYGVARITYGVIRFSWGLARFIAWLVD